jgi:hypothetical protein
MASKGRLVPQNVYAPTRRPDGELPGFPSKKLFAATADDQFGVGVSRLALGEEIAQAVASASGVWAGDALRALLT